jgi:hypothetical protein
MSDEFLNVLRRDPPDEFARRLKSRLHALDAPAVAERRVPARAYRWLATAASVTALAFAFTLPAVRSAAEAFLDYFRVVNFAGVAFDPQRAEQLWSNASVDLPTLISGHVTVADPPTPPVAYSTLDEAGAAAQIRLRAPTWLPPGFKLTGVDVVARHEFRVTGDTAKLEQVLTALGIDDLTVPPGLDGQVVTIDVPPIARILYDDGERQISLVQSRSPVVSFPAGVDLASFAEIGLRLLGLGRAEAYDLAQSIDWRSTLLVPVPLSAATFHRVEVQNGTGLAIEAGEPNGTSRPGDSVVLWSNGDSVYALRGPVRAADLLLIGQSVQ